MKIAIWNLMRPTHKTGERNEFFHETIKSLVPDILILTETNSLIDPGDLYFRTSTKTLPEVHDGFPYANGENRSTIYSKYPFIRVLETSDDNTSVCAEISTPFGNLIIYGTIIGITGGKDDRFKMDLKNQANDLKEIIKKGAVCFAGDFNTSFSGYTYPSHETRNEVENIFSKNSIRILTKDIPDIVDHVAISNSFLENLTCYEKRVQL